MHLFARVCGVSRSGSKCFELPRRDRTVAVLAQHTQQLKDVCLLLPTITCDVTWCELMGMTVRVFPAQPRLDTAATAVCGGV
jgi:hypothetical protein